MVAPTLFGGLVRVNISSFSATGNQYFPHATALSDGRIAIAWNTTNGYEVKIMAADGVTESANQTYSFTGNLSAASGHIDIAQLSDGRLVATWRSIASDASGDISWAYLDPSISAGAGPVNTFAIAGTNSEPMVGAGKYGRFVIVDTETGTDVFRMQSVSGIGNAIFGPGELSSGVSTTGSQNHPNIVGLADGRFMTVWYDANDSTIKGAFLDSGGGRFSAFTIGTSTGVGAGQDGNLGLAATPDGGFAVVWSDGAATVFRTFSSNGTALIAQTTIAGLNNYGMAVTALQDGRLAIIGTTGLWDVKGQMVNANGTLDGGLFDIGITANNEFQPDVVTLADGRFAVTYSSSGVTGGDTQDIVMKIFDPRTTALNGVSASSLDDKWFGTAFADFVLMGAGDDTFDAGAGVDFIYGEDGNDTLIGGAGGDTLIGGNGNDTLNGDANDDALHGEKGADTLNGGDGNDILYGGAGADTLNGGNGFDYASYLTASSGVNANLATPAGTLGDAGGDIITGIEGLIGSQFSDGLFGDASANWIYGADGNDDLYGYGGDDVLIAGNGDDYLEGGVGADALYGEAGFDSVGYTGALAGVTVDLQNSALNAGDAAGDTFNSIEGIYGSDFADTLRGDGGDNKIFGGFGADTLVGRTGNDELYGSDGDDVLNGGGGADTMSGGSGFDYASYADHLGGLTADLQIAANNTGEAAGDSYLGIEGLLGTGFDDSLRGNALDNWIYGGGGADFIYGRDGADTLLGEAGDDVLYGNVGNDRLYGGAGNDTFVFGVGDGKDVFADFVGGAGASDAVLLSTALGVSNFVQLLTKAAQVGSDVVITFDINTSITLVATSLAGLNADDFGFY